MGLPVTDSMGATVLWLRTYIWISRRGGSLCRHENLTRHGLLANIAEILFFSDCRLPNGPPEEPAVHLIVSHHVECFLGNFIPGTIGRCGGIEP
jgi:hypothetical protein